MLFFHCLVLIFATIVAFISYWNSLRGEVELLPFALSQVTLAILPTTFPSNNTLSAHLFRTLLGVGSFSIETPSKISSIDVYIDDVVPGDKRLVRVFNAANPGSEYMTKDVIVFYFAGAWMLGDVAQNDRLCKKLAQKTNTIVVCPEYSLAPEHPFPRAFNDAVAALRWTKRNIAHYGGNPDRIFFTGESAGGNLATAVSLYNCDPQHTSLEEHVPLLGLLLVYPPTAANFSTDSYVRYARYNGMLTAAEMQHAWRMYAGGDTAAKSIARTDYRYQPLYAPDTLLAQLPPTFLVVAEYDVLRDDSLLLAARLREVGVSVTVRSYPTIHGFFGRDASALGAVAVDDACAALLEMGKRNVA